MADDAWIPLWENVVLRTAAFLVAAGIVWRYAVFPLFKTVRAFFKRAKKLTAEVEEVRRLVASQHTIINAELKPNGGGSTVDKIDRLAADLAAVQSDLTRQHAGLEAHIAAAQEYGAKRDRESEAMAAAFIKYSFDHRRDHKELHDWLRETFGIDRRQADEEALGAPERRSDEDPP